MHCKTLKKKIIIIFPWYHQHSHCILPICDTNPLRYNVQTVDGLFQILFNKFDYSRDNDNFLIIKISWEG